MKTKQKTAKVEDKTEKPFCIDNVIKRLTSLKDKKPGTFLNLKESEIMALIEQAKEIFSSQPIFLELSAPLKICGDIHGQFYDLLRVFDLGGFPPKSNYLFLGDYVDRGNQNIETICLFFAYKIKYPENFFLLRGNHETESVNRIYGFYEECKRRYSVKLWKTFGDCFNFMPVAALIEDRILCMHGGLSPDLIEIDQIKDYARPTDIPDNGVLCDLLWSDPDENTQGWGENERGVSYIFGKKILTNFLNANKLDLVVRGHQVVEDGYEFFCNKKLVTIFSAPNYCDEFDNSAGIMEINENLVCSFKILEPEEKQEFVL